MKLLIDTHIWIWALAGSAQLPERFQDTLASHRGDVWLSPISVWEALVLARRGRIDLKPDPVRWVQEGLKRWPINEAPLNMVVAIRSEEVDLPHRDPADRIIAATALVYGLNLMTLDERLLSATWLPTV